MPQRDEPRRRKWIDVTGGFRRPVPHEFADLLLDDGRLDRSEQLKIMEKLLPAQSRRSATRFFFMLSLSVTIAVMGLTADSAAVVIGAMLIAPLMTPIMAFAAATGLGLGHRAAQAGFLVVAGVAWSVGLAVVLAALLPEVTIGPEILARTSPDIRDLVVAVAAGAAGAYAIAREDVSAALPGVAVAVALVPPLATTGVLIERGDTVLAEGSALLFLTNLLAIIVSAILVLLATGVVPTIRLCFRSSRIALTMVGILVATTLIAVPLTTRSLEAADSSRQRTDVVELIDQWLDAADLNLTDVAIDGATVTVGLAGLDEPPPAYDLAIDLVPLLGPDAEAVVEWDQRALGVARADSPPAADPVAVATVAVEQWIDGLTADGLRFELLDVAVAGDRVTVELSGPTAPPAASSLPDDVAAAIGIPVELSMRWIQEIEAGFTGESGEQRLRRWVDTWIGPRAGVRLVNVDVGDQVVTIDLATDGQPLGIDRLRRLAIDAVGIDRVDIRSLPLVVLGPDADDVAPPALD